jgi:hypothetical protein
LVDDIEEGAKPINGVQIARKAQHVGMGHVQVLPQPV